LLDADQFDGLALSARDAVQSAVMVRHGVDRIMTFESGSDAHPDVRLLAHRRQSRS
jgi:predicted nucleic acid-binding protein